MIGRRGLLGLLAALPFAGRAVASVPQDPTIWIRTTTSKHGMEFPIPWERRRFATFEEHVDNYSQGWGEGVEWSVTYDVDAKPVRWQACRVAVHPNEIAQVGDVYYDRVGGDTYLATADGWVKQP